MKARQKEDSIFAKRATPKVAHTFRIPAQLHKGLQELAKSTNLSFNEVVVRCIEFALKEEGYVYHE